MRLIAAVVVTALSCGTLRAQAWNGARARQIVERAVARRSAQLSDSGLAGYSAMARGTLEFLAQLGDTALTSPRIVRSAELAVEIHWTAPNISRQVVVGERDTTLVPMDIGFYSDRYGVVQSNFPDVIRLGDGQDVKDVTHPVSANGLRVYDFALRDSLAMTTAGRRVDLYAVAFRPRDAAAPLAVGTVYLDRQTADIVRLDLAFPRAAIRDQRIEVLTVVLENALVDGRFWLPHRQELEVQRGGTVLDFPARGIVRGRWTVCCYDLSPAAAKVAAAIPGGAITFRSPALLHAYAFNDSVFADLRDSTRAVRPADIARVQSLARDALTRKAFARTSGAAFAVTGVSDFARFTRAEGFAFGGGGVLRLGSSDVRGRARYGMDDERVKGEVALGISLGAPTIQMFAEREYRDVADVAEVSGARNSLAAQEFAYDATDPYDVRAVGMRARLGRAVGLRWSAEGSYESQHGLAVRARPLQGTFAPLPSVRPVHGIQVSLAADAARLMVGDAGSLRASAMLRAGSLHSDDDAHDVSRFARIAGQATTAFPFARGIVISQTQVGIVATRGPALPQQLVYLGGPVTGPGYGYHQFVGSAGATQRVEWKRDMSVFAFPLGRYGSTPVVTAIIPFGNAVFIHDDSAQGANEHGVFPSLGVGLELFSGTLRADLARGLRGRRWTFAIDAGRSLWSIL